MTPEQKKYRVLIAVLILCAMLVSGFFSLRHGPYRSVFAWTFNGFVLLNAWLSYTLNKNRRQPDTLIHLFPASPDHLKEIANS